MTTTSKNPGPSNTSSHKDDWVLLAPVFDNRRKRPGLWLEVACDQEQFSSLSELLVESLREHPPEWLFLVAPALFADCSLPLDLPSDQILVRPVQSVLAPAGRPQPPAGLSLGLRGTRAEVAAVSKAASSGGMGDADWHIVTDPTGPADHRLALADGLSGWHECQPLADLGWKAFLFTGNQGAGGKQPKADQIALTRLLGLVTSDADIDELESLFKAQPRLAFDLLNLVNSPALNLRTPATNFRHAITLLGRRQLQRWLQLLMFTRQGSKNEVNILLWHSAFRGRFMERIAQRLGWSTDLIDHAFMVGVFSLIDVLLGDSLRNLLRPLALPPTISAALLDNQGPLGDVLALAQAIEARESHRLTALSQQFALDALTLLTLQLETLFWVESFSAPSG